MTEVCSMIGLLPAVLQQVPLMGKFRPVKVPTMESPNPLFWSISILVDVHGGHRT